MIDHINQEMLTQRMMRGVVTGPAEQEKEPMKRCTGKLENGRQCAVVPLSGEMCSSCQKRGAEIYIKEIKPLRSHDLAPKERRGRPAKKGDTPWHVEELLEMVETPSNLQIPPTETDLNQEQVDPLATPSSGLARLLRPSPPPLPLPDGIFIPFTLEEAIALIESDVSAEDIRQFVLLGLMGEVCRIDHEDPLAKSRER